MSESARFVLISSAMLPLGVVAALVLLAALWSRSSGYTEFIRHGAGRRWLAIGLCGGLGLCLGAVLSPRPLPHLGLIFGWYAGMASGSLAGLVLAVFLLLCGWPLSMALTFFLCCPLGTLARRLPRKAGLAILALLAAAGGPATVIRGWTSEPIQKYLALLSPEEMKLWIVVQTLLAPLLVLALIAALEYLARSQERRAAQMLWRVLEMMQALRQPNAEALSQALGVECRVTREVREVGVRDGVAVLPLPEVGSLLVPVPAGHPLADESLVRAIASLFAAEHAHQMRYRLLAAQIQPHFLFNSLTAIAGLVLTRPAEAHDLIGELAEFLRHGFAHKEDFVPLEEELDCVRAYLAIERARFQERLQASLDVDPRCLDRRVPSMLLQPLVENAVRHGVAGNGRVSVRIRLAENERLEVEVEDDGAGFRAGSPAKGHGIGLSNVRQRVEALGGELGVSPRPGGGTVVAYSVPGSRR